MTGQTAPKETVAFFNVVLRNYIACLVFAAALSLALAFSEAIPDILLWAWPPNDRYLSTGEFLAIAPTTVRAVVAVNSGFSLILLVWLAYSLTTAVLANVFVRFGQMFWVLLSCSCLCYFYSSLGFSGSISIFLITESDIWFTAAVKSACALSFFYWLTFLTIHGVISYFKT